MHAMSSRLEQDLTIFSRLPEKIKSALILEILRPEIVRLQDRFEPILELNQLKEIFQVNEQSAWFEDHDQRSDLGAKLSVLRSTIRLIFTVPPPQSTQSHLDACDAWAKFANGWSNIMALPFLPLDNQENIQTQLHAWQAHQEKLALSQALPTEHTKPKPKPTRI